MAHIETYPHGKKAYHCDCGAVCSQDRCCFCNREIIDDPTTYPAYKDLVKTNPDKAKEVVVKYKKRRLADHWS